MAATATVAVQREVRAARVPKAIWRTGGSGHTGGISARPRAYERRVVGFFDQALLDPSSEGE